MDLNAVFLSEDMLTAPETQTMGKHALKNISDAYAEQQDVAASPEAGRNLSREEEELKTTLTKEKALEFVKEVQKRFKDQPKTFDCFVAALYNYTNGQTELEGVRSSIAQILTDANEPDLYDEFEELVLPNWKARADKSETELLHIMAAGDANIQSRPSESSDALLTLAQLEAFDEDSID
ncbi:MAG: hypothetical protein Q9190_003047 [Brigantiaea leucoxantha]